MNELEPIEPEQRIYTKADKAFAGAMFVCGFLYWNLNFSAGFGAGVTIFSFILCTVIFVYLKKSGIRQSRKSLFWLGIIVLSAINFVIFANTFLYNLNFMFLSILFVYWVCLSTGRQLENKMSVYLIGDLINQSIVIPLANFLCWFGALKNTLTKNKHSKSFLGILVGILISLPIMILVINLLINADAAFESLIAKINFSLSNITVEYMVQLILEIPVACYIYGLVYGDRYARHTNHITMQSLEKNTVAAQFAPGITIYTALTILNAIYLLFFLAQSTYLFSAFDNDLPGIMTYAEYARRGFFELCAVAAINLCVLIIAYLITNRKSENPKHERILRVEMAVLCIFTLMLIITALSKMFMYIHYYGLTQLRVYATWFMILVFAVFFVLALRQFKRFNASKIITISVIASFLLLCYGNVDGIIAKYNIYRYENGTLNTIDVAALSELSDAAVPYLYQLYQETSNEALKDQLKSAITGVDEQGMEASIVEPTFRNFNLQTYRANNIRTEITN